MATYRAKAKLFIDRLLQPGEVFKSELPPGLNWEPVDAEAKAKCAELARLRGGPATEPEAPEKPAAPNEVPADWMDLPSAKVIDLARRLGAPNNCNYTRAVVHIEKLTAARAEAAQMQGAA